MLVGGVTVLNVTLHNRDEIARLGLRVGDRIVMQRAGDVIPQVVENLTRYAPRDAYLFPETCPECGSEAVAEEGEVDVRCTAGLTCPAQRFERLRHFVSRPALDIEGLGEDRMRRLVEEGIICSPADIFRLRPHRERMLSWKGWGEKLSDQDKANGDTFVDKLLKAIEDKRAPDAARLLFAMGIRHVGIVTARELMKAQTDIVKLPALAKRAGVFFSDLLRNTGETKAAFDMRKKGGLFDIIGTDGMEVVARSLCAFFHEPHNLAVWKDLLSEVNPPPYKVDIRQSAVSGKTVVFTGRLETMSRDEAKSQAEALGAKASGSVSSQTGLVVAGPGAGSKLKIAIDLGIQVISEQEWRAILDSAL